MKKRHNQPTLAIVFCVCLAGIGSIHCAPEDSSTDAFDISTLLTPEPIAQSDAPDAELNNEVETLLPPAPTPLSTEPQTPPDAIKTELPITRSEVITEKNIPIVPAAAFNNKKIPQPHKKKSDSLSKSTKKKPLQEQGFIEFQFEEADLQTLIAQVAELFSVTFITDDMIIPLPKDGKAITGNKISFKTNRPLSQGQAWNLFITFLDLAGFTIVPQPDPSFYRIVKTDVAKRSAIPVLIGLDYKSLPDSDQMIRYVYFVQNSDAAMLKTVIDASKSSVSEAIIIEDLNAIMITDRSYNIKTLMEIITTFDSVTQPQAMSIVKLKRANAEDVKKICESLMQSSSEDKTNANRFIAPMRKQPTTTYFPEGVRIIAEPRSNVVILLGTHDGIRIIENFITETLDKKLEQPYAPLRTYVLKYADATTMAKIMTDLVAFGSTTAAGKVGGVRDGDKYLRNVTFTADTEGNRLIIRANAEDYNHVKEILDKLDEPQPQVSIEVLIFSIDLLDSKAIGSQLRSTEKGINTGLLGSNVNFQTSGLRPDNLARGIVTNSTGEGVDRLMGNLVSLVTGAGAGNTVVTFGQDAFGVWGIFNAFQKISNTQIIANPFLVATNKQKASVIVGETRRIVSSQAFVNGSDKSVDSFQNQDADLKVEVTPQINSDGMIILNLTVTLDAFINENDVDARLKNKSISTQAIVANGEILALGGLMKTDTDNNSSKVPILGDIPLFGWFFKNRGKVVSKETLLVLVSVNIIKPEPGTELRPFTQQHINSMYTDIERLSNPVEKRDPIHRFMFGENANEHRVGEFYMKKRHGRRSRKVARSREKPQQSPLQQVAPQFAQYMEGNNAPGYTGIAQAQTLRPIKESHKSVARSKPALTDFFAYDGMEAL